MKKTLIYHIAKQHRLHAPLASLLGKSQEAVRKQLARGNPPADERFRINDAFYKLTNREIDSIALWSPTRKDQYHKYL